jgi:hypothetical protein
MASISVSQTPFYQSNARAGIGTKGCLVNWFRLPDGRIQVRTSHGSYVKFYFNGIDFRGLKNLTNEKVVQIIASIDATLNKANNQFEILLSKKNLLI